MKTIIAVTFFGILTYAFAEMPSQSNICKHRPMKNFDSTKYLKMTRAFPTYSTLGTRTTICRLYKTEQKSDDTVDIDTYQYYMDRRTIYYSEVHCNTTVQRIKKGQFNSLCKQVMVTARRKDKQTISNPRLFRIYTSIIDTDYDKYIIHYRCTKTKTKIIDNTELLLMDVNVDNEIVKNALEKNGMKLEDLIPYDDPKDCKDLDDKSKEKELLL